MLYGESFWVCDHCLSLLLANPIPYEDCMDDDHAVQVRNAAEGKEFTHDEKDFIPYATTAQACEVCEVVWLGQELYKCTEVFPIPKEQLCLNLC